MLLPLHSASEGLIVACRLWTRAGQSRSERQSEISFSVTCNTLLSPANLRRAKRLKQAEKLHTKSASVFLSRWATPAQVIGCPHRYCWMRTSSNEPPSVSRDGGKYTLSADAIIDRLSALKSLDLLRHAGCPMLWTGRHRTAGTPHILPTIHT
eukprot:3276184-Rhodomonas_salina.1